MMRPDHPSASGVRWWAGGFLICAAIWLAFAGVIVAATLLFR
jgi:hypothetical protein